ncbi:hypothetical protein [Lactococcus lactis]|uniref:hypothetical protein n=1 Tax=Lactococcus lactis TaxID=1358 RepID=UPI0018A8D02F|nr:hypothetical protein [Lactococcus lactis]
MLEVIIWQFLSETTIILNRHLFFQMEKIFYQDNIGRFLGSLDWSAIVAAIAVVISVIALGLQRIDLKKQAKYQRDTFELQNIIDSNKTIIQLIGEINSMANDQVNALVSLPEKIFYESYYHEKYIHTEGDGKIYHNNYKTYYDKVIEARQEFKETQAIIVGKMDLISILTEPKYYSKDIYNYLVELFVFLNTKHNETKEFDVKNSEKNEEQIKEEIEKWKITLFEGSVKVKEKIVNEAKNIQVKTEVEKGKLL